MKSLLYCIVIFTITLSYNSTAQSLKLVYSDTLNYKELLLNSQTFPTEYFLPNKVSLGKFNVLDIYEILKQQLKSLSTSELRNTIIIAESSTGETITFSAIDIHPEISKLPGMLVLTSINSNTDGLSRVQDAKSNKGRVDLSKLEALIGASVRHRVGLQLQNNSKDTRSILKQFSIIFPIDAKTDRWLTDVKILKIFTVTK